MKTAENIEKLIKEFFKAKKLFAAVSPQMDEKVLNDALAAFEKSKINTSAKIEPSVWRIIMKSKITKFSVAAIIVIAVIIIGINHFSNFFESSAYAQVAAELRNARTVVYTLITQTNQGNGETVKTDVAYKEPGLLRMSTVDGYVIILDSTSGKVISIVPTLQMYTIGEIKNLLNNIDTKGPFDSIESMKSLPAKADEHLDPKEIEGIVCRGYRVKQGDLTTTVWIDAKTGDLVQVEQKYVSAPGMNKIIKNIKFDVVLDDSLFSLTPPEGYRASELKSDAFASAATEDMFIEFMRLWSSLTVDGTFPPLATPTPKVIMDMGQQGKLKGDWTMAVMIRMTNGMQFVYRLPQSSNWRYMGENVKFGTSDKAIFWYMPKGSQNYRVIYGDLSVREVAPADLPK
jgi:outer membrane lipoprotein-sorting protein